MSNEAKWKELQSYCTPNTNFILNRWDTPLHNDTATEQQGRLWPSSQEFYHPLNPILTPFLNAQLTTSLLKVALLRDGAQGILEFFLRFPTPAKLNVQLLVPADLSFLVPEGWYGQCYAYRLTTDRPMTHLKNYLFYGLLSEMSLCWPRFQRHIDQWLKQFDPKAPVKAFFATRNEMYDPSWVDRKIASEITSKFQYHFENRIESITWPELQTLSMNADLTYINLDQWQDGIGLCSVDSLMMSKAAQVWGRGVYHGFKGEKLGTWPLSFQHTIDVFTLDCQHKDFAEFFFIKKTTPKEGPMTLAHPIIPRLIDLLAERLTVKGLDGGGARPS